MAHDHAPSASTDTAHGRLVAVICIVAGVFVIEIMGALVSGSLALFADAGHMFSDLLGLIVALIATRVAKRPPTERQTFGFQRAEVFGAMANGLILFGVAVWVSVEAIVRLTGPEHGSVQSVPMLVVAVLGLFANIVSIFLLRPSASRSINMRGAYLEVLGDTVGSVVAIVAATVIITTGFAAADAIASLFIAAFIIPRALVLLRDVFRVLSGGAPSETDVAEIRRHILDAAGVVDVHDIHVWSITSGAHVFSAHVVVASHVFREHQTGPLLDYLSSCLATHFDVDHSTFQLEPQEHAEHEPPQHR